MLSRRYDNISIRRHGYILLANATKLTDKRHVNPANALPRANLMLFLRFVRLGLPFELQRQPLRCPCADLHPPFTRTGHLLKIQLSNPEPVNRQHNNKQGKRAHEQPSTVELEGIHQQ